MTLALAHGHADPAFNSLFFTTAALVIPVLFLALAVPGGAYQTLLTTFTAMNNVMKNKTRRRYQQAAAGIAATALVILAMLLPVAAVVSDVFAFYALYRENAEGTTWQVYAGVVGLVIATAAVPALKFLTAYFVTMGANMRDLRNQLVALLTPRQHGPRNDAGRPRPEIEVLPW